MELIYNLEDALNRIKLRIVDLEREVTKVKRDHNAAIGALRVCQTTIETLTTELFALHPHNQAVGNARDVLNALELIVTPDPHPIEDGEDYKPRFSDSKIFGKVKREIK